MTQPIESSAPRPQRRGLLIIISSPSGAGKTTLAHRLLQEFPNTEFSVSCTTRAPRHNEEPGRDYHFVTNAEFDRLIEDGQFAEWAQVHGNRYGTTCRSVERALEQGRDMIFDIDWQGGRALSEQWPHDSLKIFVLPPDLDTLEARLRSRATDAEEIIRLRLRKSVDEMRHYREYEHIIVNDDLEEAYATLRALYLVRVYGEDERPDVPYPLTSLAVRVRQNRMRNGAAHAVALIAQGQAQPWW